MAGITDQPFRLTVKRLGASLMFTEMVSAEGLVRSSSKTYRLMEFSEEERPVGIQLFGNRPESMADAARIAESLQPDLIDLNFGCPVKKVVNGGAGSAVLRDLNLLTAIVRNVIRSVSTPVSCKIRSGWDENHINAEEAARIIEGEGAAMLIFHARTRSQGFSGVSDWSLISRVKKCIAIPVIGNGDIHSPEDARRMIRETGCEAVMIGRGVLGRPWMLSRVDTYLQTGKIQPEPDPYERIRICLKHFDLALQLLGSSRGVREMRKHIGWTLRGMKGAAAMRSRLMTLEDPDQVKTMLLQFVSLSDETIV